MLSRSVTRIPTGFSYRCSNSSENRTWTLRNAADDGGPEPCGEAERQLLPRGDRQVELRIARARVGQRPAGWQVVLPMIRPRRGAPLLFEFERAFVGRGAAEIERGATLADRMLDDRPVQQVIRAQRVVLAQRRVPGDLQGRQRPVRDAGLDR